MEGTISQPRHRARGHRRTETDAEAKPWPLGTYWQQPRGTPTGVTWQPCASTGGTGDRDGDPPVSPSWPRPPRPPSCSAGPGVMGKAARNRDSARAIQRLSPPAAATAVGTGTSHPRALGKRGCHGGHRVPSGAQHLPDAGVPPGRAPAARQHRPAPVAPVAVARPSPAVAVPAGTASCHPAAPCFPASASHPRWYRRHKAALSLRRPRGVMPASVPGPVPPPLTPLPPQGTAPGDTSPCHGAGAQLTPLASALMTSERCPWLAGGGRGRYK